jgi:hypothetical protein
MMMFRLNYRMFLAALFLAPAIGCSPLQGYQGKPLPDDQTALVDVSGSGDVGTSGVTINGTSFTPPAPSVSVLPGLQLIAFEWAFDTSDEAESAIDFTWQKHGRCEVDFLARAGAEYLVSAAMYSSGTWVSNPTVRTTVRERGRGSWGAGDTIATRDCEYTGRGVDLIVDPRKLR